MGGKRDCELILTGLLENRSCWPQDRHHGENHSYIYDPELKQQT